MTNKEKTVESGTFRCINFTLGQESYGQDISYIQEVNRVQNITEVPGTPEYILGVINLRGSVIPVMNLRKRLGLPVIDFTPKSRVIVIEYRGSRLGLLVDSVSHVLEIPLTQITDPPDSMITERNRFISGIGQMERDLIFLVDIEKIFSEEALNDFVRPQKETTI